MKERDVPDVSKPPASERVEALLDEMIAETFPASDPPQLDGAFKRGPAENAVPRHPDQHAPPPDVAADVDDTALDVREGRYSLGNAGEARLRTDAEGIDVHLPANPLRLDAAALEALIAALQKHRPPLR